MRRETGVDELDESEKEFGDGGDVGLIESEVCLLFDRRRDPCRGRGDRMVDERAKLAALQLGSMTRADAAGNDGKVKGGHHRHRPGVVGLEELRREDRAMCR